MDCNNFDSTKLVQILQYSRLFVEFLKKTAKTVLNPEMSLIVTVFSKQNVTITG